MSKDNSSLVLEQRTKSILNTLLKSIPNLSTEEKSALQKMPLNLFDLMANKVFNNNESLARNFIYGDSENIYIDKIKSELLNISNYQDAIDTLSEYTNNKKKILFLSDDLNENKMSLAILEELKIIDPKFKKIIPVSNKSGNQIFSINTINESMISSNISKNDDFLILASNTGINSLKVQRNILRDYPNARMLITDSNTPIHKPELIENDRTVIFSPKHKPTAYFQSDENISGVHVLGLVAKGVCKKLGHKNNDLETIDNICRASNFSKYINADIRLKPTNPVEVVKINNLNKLTDRIDSIGQIINVETKKVLQLLENINSGMDIYRLKKSIDFIKTNNKLAFNTLYNDKELKYNPTKNYFSELSSFVFQKSLGNSVSIDDTNKLENAISLLSKTKESTDVLEDELRKSSNIVSITQGENVKVVSPVIENDKEESYIYNLFSKRFIMKSFEDNDKEFYAILNKSQENNSFTGVYNSNLTYQKISSLVRDNDDFNISFKGQLIGSKIKLYSTNSNENIIDGFVSHLDDKIKKQDNKLKTPYAITDLSNFSLVNKINESLNSNLNNDLAFKSLMKLDVNHKFTVDKKGDENALHSIGIKDVLDMNDSVNLIIRPENTRTKIILSAKIIKSLSENDFKDYIDLDFIGNNEFRVSSVITEEKVNDNENNYKLPSFSGNFLEKDYNLFDDKTDTFLIERKNIAQNFFKSMLNYENDDFHSFENLLIEYISSNNLDNFVFADYKSDSVGNLGLINDLKLLKLEIDPESGKSLSYDDWAKMSNNSDYDELKLKIKNITFDEQNEKVIINRRLKFNLLEKSFNIDFESSKDLKESLESVDNKLLKLFKNKKIAIMAHNANYPLKHFFESLPKFSNDVISKATILDTSKFTKTEKLGYQELKLSKFNLLDKEIHFFDDELDKRSISNKLKNKNDFNITDVTGQYILKRITKNKEEKFYLMDRTSNNNIVTELDVNTIKNNTLSSKNKASSAKYKIEELGNFNIIKRMMGSKSDSLKELIETPKVIKDFGDKIDILFQNFIENFDFNKTIKENINDLKDSLNKFNKNKELDFLNKVVSETDDNAFKGEDFFNRGASLLIEANKDIYLDCASINDYLSVLNIYEPTSSQYSRDIVKHISEKTLIDSDRVKEILDNTAKYKKENNTLSSNLLLQNKQEISTQLLFSIVSLQDKKRNRYIESELYKTKTFELDNSKSLETLNSTSSTSTIESIVNHYLHKNNSNVAINSITQKQKKLLNDDINNETSLFSYDTSLIDYGRNVKLESNKVLSEKDIQIVSDKIEAVLTYKLLVSSLIKKNSKKFLKEKIKDNNIDLSKLNPSEKNNMINGFKVDILNEIQNISPKDKSVSSILNSFQSSKTFSDSETKSIFKTLTKGLGDKIESIEKDIQENFGDFYYTKESNQFKNLMKSIVDEIQGKGSMRIENAQYLSSKNIKDAINMIENHIIPASNSLNIDIDKNVTQNIKDRLRAFEPIEYNDLSDSLDLEKNDFMKLFNGHSVRLLNLVESLSSPENKHKHKNEIS